jgi:hypothetical protein
VILFFFGLSGISYQTLTGEVNVPLLLVFAASTGAPALINSVAMLLRGGGIGSSPSSSPAPDSPSPSSNASS